MEIGQKNAKYLSGKIQNEIQNIMDNSLACAARLADTKCPPEAPFGRQWSPLFSYIGDNISNYVCLTVIIDIARKITKFVNFKNFDT